MEQLGAVVDIGMVLAAAFAIAAGVARLLLGAVLGSLR
jgi:hypothetical protein